MKVGYARCSTEKQDLRAQKQQLQTLGVDVDRIYVDHGYTGRKRTRPGLDNALAACRAEDFLVVTKLDRLGRSISDLSAIGDFLTGGGVALQIGSMIYDPHDAVGRMFFNQLALFAEFEADLISQRTKEGLAIAKSEGRMPGKRTRLTPFQQQHMRDMLTSGDFSQADVARTMGLSQAWVSRLAKKWRAAGLLDPALPLLIPDDEEAPDAD
ncbi:recombinase family protein [Corynebacterium sp. AOP40-9SA-29]|uniref:recombinase family protein n=1 Tax=Corynebacterium sp. AOP40-9SA-29 TaxID=3457677 RepID=UPI0040335775